MGAFLLDLAGDRLDSLGDVGGKKLAELLAPASVYEHCDGTGQQEADHVVPDLDPTVHVQSVGQGGSAMQIGQFVARLHTTKETVRHHEDLQLLTPARLNHRRVYGEKEIMDFQVILELKSMGMGLREIQLLFALKQALGCGDPALLSQTMRHLSQKPGGE